MKLILPGFIIGVVVISVKDIVLVTVLSTPGAVTVTVFSTPGIVTVAVFSITSAGFAKYPKAPPTTKPPIAAPVYFK